MKNIFIVGMGLIGGSLSLALKKDESVQLIGFDISEQEMNLAHQLGVIDQKAASIEAGAKLADLIILATPVGVTTEIIERLSTITLKDNVIITDVGSTKQTIVEKARALLPNYCFIGGHPMAGSHKTGVTAAQAHLFENAFYLLTPIHASRDQLIMLKNMLKSTNAQFIELDAQRHDRLVGVVSHFPHIVAAGLVHQLEKMEADDAQVTALAAGGFKDITRIASASPVMWRDILLHNKDEMIRLIDNWQQDMNDVRQFVENEDHEQIYRFFAQARQFREGLPQKSRGAIPAFYDLYVDVPDHLGVVSDVTYVLAENKIHLTNIRILEAREDIMGVLRLSFRSETDREQAKQVLIERHYTIYEQS
ncbi:prephenate dehydrogenase [Shouchella sp. JSM 1781072]|uniref:prephenate dehydrogenase n=1 Tax=Shouchella sp. JSM 1781072 TaxID=3344581 RepID=UPI0035C1EDD4